MLDVQLSDPASVDILDREMTLVDAGRCSGENAQVRDLAERRRVGRETATKNIDLDHVATG